MDINSSLISEPSEVISNSKFVSSTALHPSGRPCTANCEGNDGCSPRIAPNPSPLSATSSSSSTNSQVNPTPTHHPNSDYNSSVAILNCPVSREGAQQLLHLSSKTSAASFSGVIQNQSASHVLPMHILPNSQPQLCSQSSFSRNLETCAHPNGRGVNSSLVFPSVLSHPVYKANTQQRSISVFSTPPANTVNQTPSSSSSAAIASATKLSPKLTATVLSNTPLGSQSPHSAVENDIEFPTNQLRTAASTVASASAASGNSSLRGSTTSSPSNGSQTPPRAFIHPPPPALYQYSPGLSLHHPYHPHEAAFYHPAYFHHSPPLPLSQPTQTNEYEYSANSPHMSSNAAAMSSLGVGASVVYPPDLLYTYPHMYGHPLASSHALYYPYAHNPHVPPHPAFYDASTVPPPPSLTQKLPSSHMAASLRSSDKQVAVPAFGSTDEINHTLSTTSTMLAANGVVSNNKPALVGNAMNANRSGIKRRKRPVSSLEEMLYRLSEFSAMEKRLKSKNKACATLGYSKGTINSYIDKVHAALESGVEIGMMSPLTAFDIRRMIHKRSEGKKEQQEKLVHHQKKKQKQNIEEKVTTVNTDIGVKNEDDDEFSVDEEDDDNSEPHNNVKQTTNTPLTELSNTSTNSSTSPHSASLASPCSLSSSLSSSNASLQTAEAVI